MYLFNIRRRHIPGGTIVRKSIADATISGVSNSYTYTGEAISPLPTVRLGDTLLAANEDYTVSYSDNTEIGMATIMVAGMGNYYGTATATFYITPAGVGWNNFDITKTSGTPDATAALVANVTGTQIEVFTGGVIAIPVSNGFKRYDFTNGSSLGGGLTEGAGASAYFNATGGKVSQDGLLFYCSSGAVLGYATAATAYALDGLSFSSKSGVEFNATRRMVLSGDGTRLFMIGMWDYGLQGKVYLHNLSTAFDFSTISNSADAIIDFGYATSGNYQDFCFSPDGMKMVWYNAGTVSVFALSDAWDISTASLVGSKAFTLSAPATAAIAVNPSGSKLYILDNGTLKEYALTA